MVLWLFPLWGHERVEFSEFRKFEKNVMFNVTNVYELWFNDEIMKVLMNVKDILFFFFLLIKYNNIKNILLVI